MASESAESATLVEVLREQLGAPYARFEATAQARHAALLSQVTSPVEVALEAIALEGGEWALTVCTADALGTLSLIAGLLTAERLDIVEADVFSMRVPVAQPQSRVSRTIPRRARNANASVARVLDIFRVRALPGVHEVNDATWQRLRDELATVVAQVAAGQGDAARDHVVERVSEALGPGLGASERLWPVTIETSSDAWHGGTTLHIRGQDSPGFLFELVNALALLGVNILRAEVRTVDGEPRDTFQISDAQGAPISDSARLAQIRAAAALIKQFTSALSLAPDPALALRQFGAFTRQLLVRPDWLVTLTELRGGEALQTLAEVMGASAFLWEDFLRMQHANLFPLVGDAAALDERRTAEELRAELRANLEAAADASARRDALNAFKDREMFRVDLRHITGRIDVRAFADELTALADVVVEGAAILAEAEVARRYGVPRRADGAGCAWAIAALGKAGGRELGFASDIELLFVYEADGATDGVESVPNARYFEEWVREFLELLQTRREGVFEIDLRLRPHGDAGPLASGEAGLTEYYRIDGPAQQFERMALVKLRAVAGDAALAARIERMRDAFAYSGTPLDLEDVRHLRERQAQELVPAGAVSAKYSFGGLVDVEYWTQVQQIEAGASDERVRVTSTLAALEQLRAGGYLDTALVDEAIRTYIFLRRLIDALRVVRGHARDLTIPRADSREFAYLARRLEADPPAELQASIAQHMAFARGLWDLPAR